MPRKRRGTQQHFHRGRDVSHGPGASRQREVVRDWRADLHGESVRLHWVSRSDDVGRRQKSTRPRPLGRGPVHLENGDALGTSDLATQASGDLPLLTVFQFQEDQLEAMTHRVGISIT